MAGRKRTTGQADEGQQRLNLSDGFEFSLDDADEDPSSGNNGPVAYTVSELTALLSAVWEMHPVLGRPLVVQGELSNVKQSARGHVYFTLKDEQAAIGGILWASTANRLHFELEPGQEVYLTGRLEIYRPSGTYSIVASKMEPVGVGALQLAFQQIKERLEAEGLFLDEYKKPLPEFPQRIGIVTSSTGAVIHDMLRVLRQKNPLVDVLLHPAKVQGEGAAQEIALALRELNHPSYALDLIILGRGGGSFEDLFCFSEEPVVRAVFESTVPVITGIGHEPDYALADAAADYSASTPTAAAEWAVPDVQTLLAAHAQRVRDLLEGMRDVMLTSEQQLDISVTQLVELHRGQLESCQTVLNQQSERLTTQLEQVLQRQSQRVIHWAETLDAFNPLAILARGYTLATSAQGQVVRSVAQLKPGDDLLLRLSDGQIQASVRSVTHQDSAAGQSG